MQDFSSNVTYSPSFSYYVSGEFAAAAVKVSRESQSYNITDHRSVKVDSVNDEDADFEFETSPFHEETFVHFPTFTNVTNKKGDDVGAAAENTTKNLSGNCLWSSIRSPAASKINKRSELSSSTPKRCLLKKFLTRSHSDRHVSSKRCYFKDLMKRSHSDGGGASKTTVNGKDKTSSYKATYIGEADIRRKSYLPYRQDLIGVFAVIQRLRR